MSNTNASNAIDVQALQATVLKLSQELELFKFKYQQLQEYVFGKKSEKSSYGSSFEQPNLFGKEVSESIDLDDSVAVKGYTKKKRNTKKGFPKDLPVDEVIYEPVEQTCPECGSGLKEFSRDERDEFDYSPARFFRKKIIKLHCSCVKCNQVISGQTPNPVIPGTQLGAGFFAHLLTSRFCDHLPYYRQSQIYQREGVIIPDKNLSAYAMQLGAILEPVSKLIKEHLLTLDYLQADETRLEVLAKEKTTRGWLWVLNDPRSNLTYYEFHPSRSQLAGKEFLADYTKALQTDAYSAYNDYQGLHLGCMAHARRYFVKAKKLAPLECKKVINFISTLYRLEKQLSKQRSKLKVDKWYQTRLKLRQEKSVPILNELKEYLIKIKGTYFVQDHPMTKAINYMLSRFQTFCNYTNDGRYQIDNNDVERMIRPVAVGRKNWLFAGSVNGAKNAAIMMTIMQTCKQFKINPQRYLTDVLPKLACTQTKSLLGLTPMDWNKNQ